MFNDREILNAIISAQKAGAELIMQARDVLAETKSGRRDVVTQYDRRVQSLLTGRLSAAFPGAAFFCEEDCLQDSLSSPLVFIIDPIDGTMNFVHGFHHSAISVACMQNGRLCAASVYNPYAGECFSALDGQGAFLNGSPITAGEQPLCESVVCCGTAPYSPQLADSTFALIKKAFTASLDIRREGSAALDMCSAAAGRAGVYFEPSVSLWDIAAGMLIVREAGGLCLDLQGKPLPLDGSKSSVLAGNRKAVTEFLAMAAE